MSDSTHQTPDMPERADRANGLGSGKIPRSPINPPAPPIHPICEDDGRALEALLDGRAKGVDQGPTPPGLGERSAKLADLLSLLDQDTVDDPPADLTARTLEAVRSHEQRKRFSAQVAMLSEPRRTIGFDWRQLATAAAVFLIAASLLIPMMDRQQADSKRIAGMGTQARIGEALNSYAVSNLGQMPRRDFNPGDVWWEVGQPQALKPGQGVRSNSSHLFLLVEHGYVQTLQDMACPENMFADSQVFEPGMLDWTDPRAVSFSYQNQYAPRMLRLEEVPTMAVLADRSPVFQVDDQRRILFDPNVPFDAPSRAHHGMGQNVLRGDGRVDFLTRPVLETPDGDRQDNIWKAEGVDVYTGNETPSDPNDSMLVP